uniref:Uncharacterized protein n=1 Tax=Hyaloperonospora arabidopsidis (strain Emoy2) TaxID=559515 RepID=M4B678_HYAAE
MQMSIEKSGGLSRVIIFLGYGELYEQIMFLEAVHNLVGYPLFLRLSTCFFKRVACFLGSPNTKAIE